MSRPSGFLPADAGAIRLARSLLRTARSGALATRAPDGAPQATRVGVTTDADGTPVILVSGLAAHTPALHADPRCALLLGQPGKGDPLAHPRLSLTCRASFLEPGTPEKNRVAARYLGHQEYAKLYATLPDFRYVRLEFEEASLNAGFGRAYALGTQELRPDLAWASIAGIEQATLAHWNAEHAEAVSLIARHHAQASTGSWRLAGIDAEGIDLVSADEIRRVVFETPPSSGDELRAALAGMAAAARAARS
mgnify:CR=1 FL=1